MTISGSVTITFRQGKVESWRGVLTSEQIELIVTTQGAVMQRYGYLEVATSV